MKNFIKKPFLLKNLLWLLAIFSIASIILPFFIEKPLLEKLTFIITALAFLAAAKAIILQKEAMEKQGIIGAWQLLTTKACGNSGKKEAIEFLANKGIPLSGIDLSAETHGGFVYLQGLFKDFTGDRSKINLINANFSGANCGANLMEADFTSANLSFAEFCGANLMEADFTSANLSFAEFSNAMIKKAKFNRVNLTRVDFSSSYYFNEAEFTDNYINHKINHENGKSTDADLPKAPQGYKFELDERVDENGKPIYPLNDKKYRFIKFIKLAKE